MQQFCVIKDYTDFRAREYYGSKGVDEWTAECWEKEIESCEVKFVHLTCGMCYVELFSSHDFYCCFGL